MRLKGNLFLFSALVLQLDVKLLMVVFRMENLQKMK